MPENDLIVCGLGAHPPEETTLETLQALSRRRLVLSDLRDPKAFAWLRGFCRRLARPKSAAQVVAEARRGGVALAVWGHPQFSSRLAADVLRLAARAGLRCELMGAVSPIGSAFARSVSFLGGDYGYQGIQAYELKTLLEEPGALTTRLPLVVYAEEGAGSDWESLGALLRRNYPKGHGLRLSEPRDPRQREASLERLSWARLRGAVLLVPPPAAKAGKGRPG